MKYIKLDGDTKLRYSVEQLRLDNPEVSFPDTPSKELLASYNVFSYTDQPTPTIDRLTQKEVDGDFVQDTEGNWFLEKLVVELSAEELIEVSSMAAIQEAERKRALYQKYSDPVFFKWKLGEATEQDWLDARALVLELYANAN